MLKNGHDLDSTHEVLLALTRLSDRFPDEMAEICEEIVESREAARQARKAEKDMQSLAARAGISLDRLKAIVEAEKEVEAEVEAESEEETEVEG